jgi:hypothetical protein
MKRRTLLILIGAAVGVCVLGCLAVMALGNWYSQTPGYKATTTAEAIATMTKVAVVAMLSRTPTPISTSTPPDTPTATRIPTSTETPTPTNTLDPKTATAQAIANKNATATAQVAQARQGTATAQTATAQAKMTQIAANATATAQGKYATAVAQTAEANAVATVVAEAGVTKWLTYKGQQIGVQRIAWSYSLSYYRPESGKIFVSLYIVGVNKGTSEDTFNPLDIGLVDGGGEVNGRVFIEPREPEYQLCTIKPGGRCEGWWTTMIWDRPEVKQGLAFRWSPCLLLCDSQETPIVQKK